MLALLALGSAAHAGRATLVVKNTLPTPVQVSIDGSRGYLVPDADTTTFALPDGARTVTVVEAGTGCVVGAWPVTLAEGTRTRLPVEEGCGRVAGTTDALGVVWDVRADLERLGRAWFGEKPVELGPADLRDE